MIEILKDMKSRNITVCVAEIGVDIGATAVKIINLLKSGDKYYYFDRLPKIDELRRDFADIKSEADLIGIGNTSRYYDSYAWSLAKLCIKDKVRFDLVYLDGAHSFLHDAAATAVLKEMMNVGGIIVFDDLDWSYASSTTANPKMNPEIYDCYTSELIEVCQVGCVVNSIMDTDTRYRKMECSSSRRALFERVKE